MYTALAVYRGTTPATDGECVAAQRGTTFLVPPDDPVAAMGCLERAACGGPDRPRLWGSSGRGAPGIWGRRSPRRERVAAGEVAVVDAVDPE